jgi:hypothetical protein
MKHIRGVLCGLLSLFMLVAVVSAGAQEGDIEPVIKLSEAQGERVAQKIAEVLLSDIEISKGLLEAQQEVMEAQKGVMEAQKGVMEAQEELAQLLAAVKPLMQLLNRPREESLNKPMAGIIDASVHIPWYLEWLVSVGWMWAGL